MNYDDQWLSLRRRSRLWWCLFLGLIPTIILVGFAMDLVSPDRQLSTGENFVVHYAKSDFSERDLGVSTVSRVIAPIAVCENGLPTSQLQTEPVPNFRHRPKCEMRVPNFP